MDLLTTSTNERHTDSYAIHTTYATIMDNTIMSIFIVLLRLKKRLFNAEITNIAIGRSKEEKKTNVIIIYGPRNDPQRVGIRIKIKIAYKMKFGNR